MDYVRGVKPWGQFHRHCVTLANRPGTRLRAAQLRDERFLAEIEIQQEKQQVQQQGRPPLEEHDPFVEALYLVGDDIRLLIKAMTKADIGPHQRPEGPLEIIENRKKQLGRTRLAELLGQEP